MTNRKAPKVFEAKNARALSLLKSWLRTLGISYEVGVSPGVDLVVSAKDGRRVQVQVNCGESPAVAGVVVIAGGVLTGRKIQAGLDLFAGFVTSLGYEPKTPVNRGELPSKKLDYTDHFEEVSMRHTELRRCPNPSAADLERYEDVMKKATWNFLRSFGRFCSDNMLEFGDLFTHAQVWTVIYLGYYEVPEHAVTANNNEKKLYTYLTQRFLEFLSISEKKGRNIFATLDVAAIGQRGEAYDYSDKASWTTDDDTVFHQLDVTGNEDIDEAYVARNCRLDLRTPNTRRASATALLEAQLTALPHGDLIEVLTEASENKRIHPDAQREAASRLFDHRQTCLVCNPSGELTAQVGEDEDAAGVDAGGAEE